MILRYELHCNVMLLTRHGVFDSMMHCVYFHPTITVCAFSSLTAHNLRGHHRRRGRQPGQAPPWLSPLRSPSHLALLLLTNFDTFYCIGYIDFSCGRRYIPCVLALLWPIFLGMLRRAPRRSCRVDAHATDTSTLATPTLADAGISMTALLLAARAS